MFGKKRIYFELEVPNARKVELRGSFNGWGPRELKKNPHGVWKTWLMLPPGRYEYRYVVDGQWANDPSSERVPNEFGSENCVRVVGK